MFVTLSDRSVYADENLTIDGLENFNNKEFPIKTDLSKINFTEGLTLYDFEGDEFNLSNLLVDYSKVNINKHGTYNIDYYFLDSDNNKHVLETINIKMIDSIAPQASVKEILLNLNQQVDLKNYISVSDDSGLPVNVEYITNVDVTKVGFYFVNYIVSDAGGNYTTVKTKVIVSNYVEIDHEAPTFSHIREEITISQGHDETKALEIYKSGVQAYDGEVEITDQIEVVTNNVDRFNVGFYIITYYVSDAAGNVSVANTKVIVVDDDVDYPVIIGPHQVDITINTTPNFRNFVTAMDEICGDLTDEITFQNNVDLNNFGEYYITYQVEDYSGNQAEKSIRVVVKDNVKPTITVPNTLQVNIGSDLDLKTHIKVTDNYDQEIDYIYDASKLNLTTVGTYVITVQAIDQAGNIENEMFFVNVYDDSRPDVLYEDPIILGSLVAAGVSLVVILVSSIFSKSRRRRYR
jgi:hypothetical protein